LIPQKLLWNPALRSGYFSKTDSASRPKRCMSEDPMPRNKRAANNARFKALILQFRNEADETLDEGEKRLIERIAAHPEAPSIFGPIDDKTARRLLRLCIEAYAVSTNFHSMVAEAQRTLEKTPIYERAIAEFQQLLKDTQETPLNRLTAHVLPDRERIMGERQALRSMQHRVADQARIAKETVLRLGATRKWRGENASQTAAIGWIAEGVERITKKTDARLTADLAELVLGCEVTLDRVDNAAETRKREWRSSSDLAEIDG
jgi:hypothetical protein